MDALYVIGGVALSSWGLWLTITRIKFFNEGRPDTLGGNIGLLISGIGCVICGIIVIVQHI